MRASDWSRLLCRLKNDTDIVKQRWIWGKKSQKSRDLGYGIWDPRKIPSQSHLWKQGTVAPNSEIKLKISFFPGTPEKFCSEFFVTVAHFQPIKILLIGEGIFRRISFDLPRTEENELSKIYDLVKMNYENEGIQEELSQTSIENEAERLIILEGTADFANPIQSGTLIFCTLKKSKNVQKRVHTKNGPWVQKNHPRISVITHWFQIRF